MADADDKPKTVAQSEEEVLAFWRAHDIFGKSLEARKGSESYIFYDGPPFATGTPHYGHIFVSTIKDAVPRYQTMRGQYVPRRWGWDTHGLPIENIVEKDLKISGKKQIEALGIDKFNDYARSKVLEYVGEWKKTVERMGRWVDFDGSYKTMDNSYIESVWWALGELHKKGLIYEGTRVLPYCPRCETPIANSEIAMDNSYKDITDISVYVKFELLDEPGTYLVAWTTTPWTLPGNSGLAINPDATYVKVKATNKDGGEARYIFAKDRLEKIGSLFASHAVVEEKLGRELVDKIYKPLFDYFAHADLPNKENIFKVHPADFVTLDEGTGIVHMSPAFGEDDMNLSKHEQFPGIWHVGPDGRFTKEVTDFAGEPVKPKDDHQRTDIEIIKYLAQKGTLLAKEKILHSYPHCFRCETPLYYYAIPAWFVKIQDLKDTVLARNEEIDWVPAHLKHGRFAKSVAAAPDWNISRNRYWASPLPIWQCADCKSTKFVSSVAELKDQLAGRNQFFAIRHGLAENNIRQINDASCDGVKLTEEGRQSVLAVTEELKTKGITKIFSSPSARARETAQIIAEQLNLTFQEDSRLAEINTGIFDGQSVQSYVDFLGPLDQRWTRRPPGGENWRDVTQRMREAVSDYNGRYHHETILIVSHGDPLWLLESALAGKDQPATIQEVAYPANAKVQPLSVAEIDLHRPWIDEITFDCTCGGTMRRIPEVIDCWFESGSMPYAANHYPFENQDWFKENFPGDFVAEYIAQTRTWFYYMHLLSTILFDKAPFRHVVTTGNILAEDGQKMSKSKQNYPDPWLLFNKYGVDALRFYLLASPLMRSEDINFSESGVDEVFKKIILRLKNVVSFYELYPRDGEHELDASSPNVLDRWIVSRLNQTIILVTGAMERYEIDAALRPIDDLIDDLSVWYLRRSRDRLKSDDVTDHTQAAATLEYVLVTLVKVMAPFTPFIAEEVYQRLRSLGAKESVHLEDWPNPGPIDEKLVSEMTRVRQVVSLGLEARATAGIKVRQPLAGLTMKGMQPLEPALEVILLDELNIKVGHYEAGGELAIKLDTALTPELKHEGNVRELVRKVQSIRKEQGLQVGQSAVLMYDQESEPAKLLFTDPELIRQLGATIVEGASGVDLPLSLEFDGETVWFDLHPKHK